MLERLTEGVTTGLQNKSAEQRQQETKGNRTKRKQFVQVIHGCF